MHHISCFYCDHCRRETHFVQIRRASQIVGVNRSTVYYWLDRDWIHWRTLPSGRRVICQESLCRPGNQVQRVDHDDLRANVKMVLLNRLGDTELPMGRGDDTKDFHSRMFLKLYESVGLCGLKLNQKRI